MGTAPQRKAEIPLSRELVFERVETLEGLRAQLHAQEARHSEVLEQMTYALTHDLRALVRMVHSYAQLLDRRDRAAFDATGEEFMGCILDGVQRMDLLLGDLVAYSHLFRPFEHPVGAVDSEGVLESVLLNLQDVISSSEASVTYDPLPKVMCETAQVTQLFRHLIVNAIKFRRQEPPRIHISAATDAHTATFSFRDNGLGIDARFHDQIFAIFKRLHGRGYPGNGVGLAICERIVEMHGGRIWVESEPGQGAVFQFTLPV